MEAVAFIAIITSSVVLVGALTYAFVVRKKEIDVYNRETDFVEKVDHMKHESEHIHDKSQHLIEHARETAQRILEDAMTRSCTLIKQADSFQREIEQESRSTFLEASYEYSKKFETELKEMITHFKKLFEESEQIAISNSRQILEEQKNVSSQMLKEHIDTQTKAVDEELAAYRDQEKKRIEERANAAVASIVKSVVGSAFSAADHEELIKNALEEAKKEGLFDI